MRFSQRFQPPPHISDVFDIVGKTIDNVEYQVASDVIVIYFTDGSWIDIVPSDTFLKVVYAKREL
jgi:hypothetical protein